MRLEIDIDDADATVLAGDDPHDLSFTIAVHRIVNQIIPAAKDWVADTELWEEQAAKARHAETLAAIRDLKAALEGAEGGREPFGYRPPTSADVWVADTTALRDPVTTSPYNDVTTEDTAALLRVDLDHAIRVGNDLRTENERLRKDLIVAQWAALKAERVELNLRHLTVAIRIHRAATDDHSHTPVNRELWAVLEEIPDV